MEEKKLRFWENLIVAGGIALFARSYLTALHEHFEADVDSLARQGVDPAQISAYLPFQNTTLPVWAMAVLFYLAWLVFHHYVFPMGCRRPVSSRAVSYFFLTFTLLFAGAYAYQQWRVYWEISGLPADHFTFFRRTRKISLLSRLIVYLWTLFLYEALSLGFYALCARLRREGPMYALVINFLFASCLLVFWVGMGALGHGQYEMRALQPAFYLLLNGVALMFGQHYFYRKLRLQADAWPAIFMLVSGLCFFSALLAELLNTAHQYEPVLSRLKAALPQTGLIAFLTTLAAGLIGAGRVLLHRQKNQLQTQVNVKSAELHQLRAQVNPHFLFNALNTLYAVALKENAETTASGIQKLGDMMRFMLNENHQNKIPVTSEIEQLENYVEIQRMRLHESHTMRITLHLERPRVAVYLAPMLLNPLVENAFKHGISLVKPSWIHITLTFDHENLYFKVHNSLHGPHSDDPEKYNHGIGLENVKRRLNLLYPERHLLVIQESNQDFFVSLTLKY